MRRGWSLRRLKRYARHLSILRPALQRSLYKPPTLRLCHVRLLRAHAPRQASRAGPHPASSPAAQPLQAPHATPIPRAPSQRAGAPAGQPRRPISSVEPCSAASTRPLRCAYAACAFSARRRRGRPAAQARILRPALQSLYKTPTLRLCRVRLLRAQAPRQASCAGQHPASSPAAQPLQAPRAAPMPRAPSPPARAAAGQPRMPRHCAGCWPTPAPSAAGPPRSGAATGAPAAGPLSCCQMAERQMHRGTCAPAHCPCQHCALANNALAEAGAGPHPHFAAAKGSPAGTKRFGLHAPAQPLARASALAHVSRWKGRARIIARARIKAHALTRPQGVSRSRPLRLLPPGGAPTRVTCTSKSAPAGPCRCKSRRGAIRQTVNPFLGIYIIHCLSFGKPARIVPRGAARGRWPARARRRRRRVTARPRPPGPPARRRCGASARARAHAGTGPSHSWGPAAAPARGAACAERQCMPWCTEACLC